jgi:hypothetical protein
LEDCSELGNFVSFHYGSKVHFVLIIFDSLQDTPLSSLYFHWETSLSFLYSAIGIVHLFNRVIIMSSHFTLIKGMLWLIFMFYLCF